MANDMQFNPGMWDWANTETYLGMFNGAKIGAKIGSSIENNSINAYFNAHGMVNTPYAAKAMIQFYGPALARGAEYPAEYNKNINEQPRAFSTNAQRANYWKFRDYLSNHSAELYDPDCTVNGGVKEVTQMAGIKDGKYYWDYAEGICGKTAVPPSDVAKYFDLTHSHPLGGVPSGYPSRFGIREDYFLDDSDMLMAVRDRGNNFTGTFHVYSIPDGIYYQFAPNKIMLDYWGIIFPMK
jgi:hypothetical protein